MATVKQKTKLYVALICVLNYFFKMHITEFIVYNSSILMFISFVFFIKK